ncbi:MAG: PD40 domain-containing protein, partial [Candidatus Aminicenantes bacterium]|nr:PD40 domain-containing protein [Candidatus Aminicenantes bacterium]
MKKPIKINLIFAMILMLSVGLNSMDMKNKRAFTLDDVYQIKGISGLNISPDGQQLLFSVTAYELEPGKRNSEVYLLDLKTGQQIQLTVQDKSDSHPFWSGDGQKIYFLSNRKDGTQIW